VNPHALHFETQLVLPIRVVLHAASQKPQTSGHPRRLTGSESQTQHLTFFLGSSSVRIRVPVALHSPDTADPRRTTLHAITHQAATHCRTRTR